MFIKIFSEKQQLHYGNNKMYYIACFKPWNKKGLPEFRAMEIAI